MNTHARQSRCYARGNCKFERAREARNAPPVCESAAETHRSNQLKCSVRSRTILRHLPHGRRKDMVDGASIKYATIYAARWVRIYALIPAIPLCVSNRCENAAENLLLNAGNLVKTLWHIVHTYAAREFFDSCNKAVFSTH